MRKLKILFNQRWFFFLVHYSRCNSLASQNLCWHWKFQFGTLLFVIVCIFVHETFTGLFKQMRNLKKKNKIKSEFLPPIKSIRDQKYIVANVIKAWNKSLRIEYDEVKNGEEKNDTMSVANPLHRGVHRSFSSWLIVELVSCI